MPEDNIRQTRSTADINPDVTPGLLDVINGCMAKDPAKRVADGRHIVETLVAEYPDLGDYDGGEAVIPG